MLSDKKQRCNFCCLRGLFWHYAANKSHKASRNLPNKSKMVNRALCAVVSQRKKHGIIMVIWGAPRFLCRKVGGNILHVLRKFWKLLVPCWRKFLCKNKSQIIMTKNWLVKNPTTNSFLLINIIQWYRKSCV